MKLDITSETEGAMQGGAGEAVSGAPARGEDILAVVPALNEVDHIETCIRSLLEGEERLKAVRLAVADGGSQDGTQAVVRKLMDEFPNLELVDNPLRLQSAGVNRAVRMRGEGRTILVRCDAHSIYPPNFILKVADALVSRGVASIVTPMDAIGRTCFQRANAFIVDTPLGSGGSAHRGGRVSGFVDHGHHAGFDLNKFLEVDGYDETFSHNEDAEFDRRLAKAGGRIFLDANIRLSYFPRATVASLARQYFNYGKGRARNVMKHGDMPRPRQLIPPMALIACVLGLLGSLVTPWTLIAPLGYLGVLALASVAVAIKMKSPCGLLAGLASGVMHMSWSAGFLLQLARGKGRTTPATANGSVASGS
ncbi:MAG: glycosyltransferase family 2 protein [Hyphomonadaceae bacterium]